MKPPSKQSPTTPKVSEEKPIYESSMLYPQALALKSARSRTTKTKNWRPQDDPSVLDHLCDNLDLKPTFDKDGALKMASKSDIPIDDDEPDVDLMNLKGTWMPDLTLRFPPTFSDTVKFYKNLF